MARIIAAFTQFFDNAGNPLIDGKLKFLESGTNDTDKTTFKDAALTPGLENENPVPLDGAGRLALSVFGTGTYNVILLNSGGGQIQQFDPVGTSSSDTQFGNWLETETYDKGDFVRATDGDYYQSLINNNIGNNPVSSPASWELISVFNTRETENVASLSLLSPQIGDTANTKGYTDKGIGQAPYLAVDKFAEDGIVDHTSANPLLSWAFQHQGSISIFQSGAKGTLIDDDIVAIQGAIDYMGDLGGGEVTAPDPVSAYLHTRPLFARKGVYFNVLSPTTRFYNDDSQGDFWSGNSLITTPLGAGSIASLVTRYAIPSITKGDIIITFGTAGDSNNFSVGDPINLRTEAQYQVGSSDHPIYAEMNIVIAVGTGTVTLKYPVAEDHTTLSILNCQDIPFSLGGTLPPVGSVAYDFKLTGGIWETNNLHFGPQLVGINNTIHPHGIIGKAGLGWTSSCCRSDLKVDWEIVTENSVELSVESHDTTCVKGSVVVTNSPSGQCVSQAETGRNNFVHIRSLGIAGNPTFSNGVVHIQDSRYCTIKVDDIYGDSVGNLVALIAQPNHTGTNPGTRNNKILIGTSRISSQSGYAKISDGTAGVAPVIDNLIEGNFYGDLTAANAVLFDSDTTGNEVRGFFENGIIEYAADAELFNIATLAATGSYRRLKNASFHQDEREVTSVATFVHVITIPFETLQKGDEIRILLLGRSNGTNGTKTIGVNFGGTSVFNESITAVSNQRVMLDGTITIANNTTGYFPNTFAVDTSFEQSSAASFGNNFNLSGTSLIITIDVNGVGDDFDIRSLRVSTFRPSIDLRNS